MTLKPWIHLALFVLSGMFPALAAHAQVHQQPPVTAEQVVLYDDALTFAQVARGARLSTILVTGIGDGQIQGIDLSAISRHYGPDALDVVAGLSWERVEQIAQNKHNVGSFPISSLAGVGPRGLAQIAAGTNYPEHGQETGMDQGAFLFPKFSQSGGPDGQVATGAGVLMDYEAEVCVRFDRDIRDLGDFDAARKAFFLCGDFSDRATLFREINLENPYSGDGFPDAKSGPDRFPTGPFLVVPKDWKTFIAKVNFKTLVDDQTRQDVNAADMIKDLRMIVQETLGGSPERSWSYDGGRVPMIRRAAIGTESAILTGTGDGVVFREPGPELIKELMAAEDRRQELRIIDRYVRQEDAKRIYLQPGDRVRHSSNYLGWIDTRVVANAQDPAP